MTKKLHPALAGLFQALGVAIYCALIGGSFQLLKHINLEPPEFLIAVFMLVLLVFSATITGSIVFAYPAHLFLNKKIKEALFVLGFTLLYCLIILALMILIIALI